MVKPIRRIVTGHNAAGRSVILMDGPAPDRLPSLVSPAMYGTLLWRTTTSPASNRGDEDAAPAGLRVPTAPQGKGGTVIRMTEIPPDEAFGDTSKLDLSLIGIHQTSEGRKRHFMYHRTSSVDYAVVLEGEIWAVLDDEETLMKQGDVLIQRGTAHAWSNRSGKICRMLFVLIDAEPLD